MPSTRSTLRLLALRLAAAATVATLAIGPGAPLALAQTANQADEAAPPTPPCALSGSTNVFAEGRGMLTIGDVAGCPNLRYEIIPNVMINGQAAVRLLPQEGCATGGSNSVRTGDGAAGTTGSGC